MSVILVMCIGTEGRVIFPDAPGEGEGDAAGADAAGGAGGEDAVQQLTMILMTVDAEIKTLYNEVRYWMEWF